MSDPSVLHIYCLNRSEDSASLQQQRSQARGLPTDFPGTRVTFLRTELDKPQLGVEGEIYSRLQRTVTTIIHNAWPVNFNLTLPSFAPHLQGVVNLLKLSSSSTHRVHITFISSVSSVMGSTENPIPETVLTNTSAPLPMGYGQSKYIAERILGHAAVDDKLPNVDVTVVRVGQVAGPAHMPGTWNKWEWFPSLVRSSLHLGMVPASLGKGRNNHIDWVPIDVLANTLTEYALGDPKCQSEEQASDARVLHPQNANPTTWDELRPQIISALETAMKTKGQRSGIIKEVPLSAWIEAVQKDASELDTTAKLEAMLQVNPAVKLLDFYQGLLVGDEMPALCGDGALRASKHLSVLDGIQTHWVTKWVTDWVEV